MAQEIEQMIWEGIEPMHCVLKPESRHSRWPVEITGETRLLEKIQKTRSVSEILIVNDMDKIIKGKPVSECGTVDGADENSQNCVGDAPVS